MRQSTGLGRDRFDLMLETVLEKRNGNDLVLDVGCGDGYFASILLRAGFRVVEVELDRTLAKNAWKRLRNTRDLQMIVADGQHLPFDERVFDIVICSETIEHVSQPVLLLAEITLCLKEGGRLILSTPNVNGLWNLLFDQIAGLLNNLVYLIRRRHVRYRSAHISLFTYDSLLSCIARTQLALSRDLRRERVDGLLLCISFKDSFYRRTRIDLNRSRLLNRFQQIESLVARLMPRHLQSGWILLCQKKALA